MVFGMQRKDFEGFLELGKGGKQMKINTIKEICALMCDQLSLQASNTFGRTNELHNEEQVIADMLSDIVGYHHEEANK